MDLDTLTKKPHAVCVPYPVQGHINPLLKLAKLLHFNGFHVTFVNTEFKHKRLLKSRGPNSLDGLPSFKFETIPDGLPPTDKDATQDIPSLCNSTKKNCLAPFKNLLYKLNSSRDFPPVSCVVSDGCMTITLDVAEELAIPNVLFWTPSACSFLAYMHFYCLVEKGYTPLKDSSYMTNGYLDTVIDCIPGMKGIHLRDIPTFIRTTDPDDIMLNFFLDETIRTKKGSAIVLNTFDVLEQQVLDALNSSGLPTIYTIGPLQLQLNQIIHDKYLDSIGSNLWKEEPICLEWLDLKEPSSVIYVNFGSITVMTSEQLVEFALGLANSNKTFLWVIRPDLVAGETAVVPPQFLIETKERGLLLSWCPQEQVLRHPAIGGFLTHSGWNSTLESISSGVPMIGWPFFADQQINCRFCCREWGIGMEIEGEVVREKIESLVRELMEGEKGKEMKKKAMEWKKLAEADTGPKGFSHLNLDNLIHQVLLSPKR